MCFSATASFTASAALGVLGVAAISKARNKRELFLASTPLVFAVQQAIEGFIWLSLQGSGTSPVPFTYLFLFFALLWWPIYAPLTVCLLEENKFRRKIMAGFCVGGAVVGISLYGIFLQHPSAAHIVNQCIYYDLSLTHPLLLSLLYGAAAFGAGLFSSKHTVKLFSVLIGIAALVAWRVYEQNFISVWCFFAAGVSLVLYGYFVKRGKK